MSILQRMETSRRDAAKRESSDNALGVVGRLHDALGSAEREAEKYRNEVKVLESRLARLQERYDKLSQDRDSVVSGKSAVDAQYATLQTKLGELEQANRVMSKTVELEQAALKNKAREFEASSAGQAQETKRLQDLLNAEQQKTAKLEGRVAELTKVASKGSPEKKTAKLPRVIPEFIIEDVMYGGPEGRPISAKIKPVR